MTILIGFGTAKLAIIFILTKFYYICKRKLPSVFVVYQIEIIKFKLNTDIMEKMHKSGASADLLGKAKADLRANMAQRGIAAILWDVEEAGFHYIPEVSLPDSTEEDPKVARVTGLYSYNDDLYLILDTADLNFDEFYNPDNEVRPTVVTLSSDLAAKYLGDPKDEAGYDNEGDLEEWLAVADCYFEALAEEGD